MRNWLGEIDALLGEIDRNVRGAVRSVRSVFDDGPYQVLAYRGYGTTSTACIHGRAQENNGPGPSTDADSALENLMNTVRRGNSRPLAFAELAVRYGGTGTALQGDDEGFFSGRLDLAAPMAPGAEWVDYEVELLAPARSGVDRPTATGSVLVPPPTARFGVISDLDDTIIQSRVSNFLLAARGIILGNARTRLPFPGVAAFYHALRNGVGGSEQNPIFYVSSSPWNLYDVVTEFMELRNVPRGPVLLRDWDIAFGALSSTRHFDHKGAAIRSIMTMYPALPFILLGDTSQHDPEIYRQVVAEFAGRVLAIYIRDVNQDVERSAAVKMLAEEVEAAHSTLVLADDTIGAAMHAVERGWIRADALASVREEKREDEADGVSPSGLA